jgi:hypothetical protein
MGTQTPAWRSGFVESSYAPIEMRSLPVSHWRGKVCHKTRQRGVNGHVGILYKGNGEDSAPEC